VIVSDLQEEWWTTSGGTGYVRTELLAPDPKQPRRFINPEHTKELFASIKMYGVRDVIVVTPRTHTPWATVNLQYDDRPFLIVSGHRRWTGACEGNVAAIPVRVVIYRTETEHRLDASLLNGNREKLSHLEQGWEIENLRGSDLTIAQISAHFGISVPTLYKRLNLARLPADLQALLDPKVQLKKRLQGTIASALGGLGGIDSPTIEQLKTTCVAFPEVAQKLILGAQVSSHALERRFIVQRILAEVVKERKLGSVRAVEFIESFCGELKSGQLITKRQGDRYEPRKRKGVLSGLASVVQNSPVMDWKPAEIRAVFEDTAPQDMANLISKLRTAAEFLTDLVIGLDKIRLQKLEELQTSKARKY
jgi:ParB/RepB/Spo0J family partition protein